MAGHPEAVERAGVVLVVDDHEPIRFLVRSALVSAGYAVIEAVDGAEALRVTEQLVPGLILLDLDMPVLDGPGFTATYRARPGPHALVVVMSGSADGAHVAARLDAVGYLQKPFTMQALLATVACYADASDSTSV
jgi:two-component system chemotaxis response regulator CheY